MYEGPCIVKTGATASLVTVTVRVAVPTFPPVSVAEYVTVYTPSTIGDTAPTDTDVPPPIGVRVILMTTVSPPSEVAPSSVYVCENVGETVSLYTKSTGL